MVHTINYILLPNTFHCLPHHCFVPVLGDPGHLASPECPEPLLDLREDELDRVVFRRVGHVEDQPEAQSCCLCLGLVALMRREVVQEERDLVVAVSISELLEVTLELLDVDGLLEDLEVFKTLLL